MKVKRLRNGRWQARWRDRDGEQRARNFLQRPTMEELAALEQEAAAPEFTTFREFAEVWLKHAALTRSPATVMEDRKMIAAHLTPLFGDRPLAKLSRRDLEEAKVTLAAKVTRHKRPMAPKTVNMILALAKQIMQTAFEQERVGGNAWAHVKPMKVPKKAQAYWSAAEIVRFLGSCRQRDPAFAELVHVALETGMRRGELKALTVGDLDFEGRRIWVRGTYNERVKARFGRTKNGRNDDHVPMTPEVYRVLRDRRLAASTAPVFDPKLFGDAYDRLRRRAKNAGVKPIRFHDLRHTFGSQLGIKGVNAHKIKELMRHSTLAMTERYVKLSPDSLAEAIEKVSAFGLHSDLQRNA